MELYDILVVGGGVNGTAVARHAAGDGLKVLLCERDDLAEHTSSSSTKLIHGGLRYLEHYDFKLVREALIEREVLLRSAPHIIWPLRFVLPYDRSLRPAWLLRTGLFIYDHLGGRKMLPGTERVELDEPPHAGLLKSEFEFGFEYSDCWVEDSRLVVLACVDARERGAAIRVRTSVTSVEPDGNAFRADLSDGTAVRARAVVNAAGPWVEEVLSRTGIPRRDTSELRLVKGSHIVTEKLFEGDHCYIFQNGDGRIIFAIPYERHYTLIGTTDQPYSPEQGPPEISEEETDYLCSAASEYFAKPVTRDLIRHTYSGVRPLYDDRASDAASVTRDYVLDMAETGAGPVLSVYGGKITTSRHLALDAMKQLSGHIPGYKATNWTRDAHLPGGDVALSEAALSEASSGGQTRGGVGIAGTLERLAEHHPDLHPELALRLARAYGSRVHAVLQSGAGEPLTPRLPASLLAPEVDHLVAHEWAREPDDVLWRRSKMGLHMTDGERATFADWFAERYRADAQYAAQ